ncbi:unnamed protein product [Prorocentrum cordatum]|nr:unnamed protein product [Polarella glacialis]
MELYLGGTGDARWERGLDSNSPLAKAWAAAGLEGRPDCALFWDFASLFQAPRSAEEGTLFRAGLKASNIWYGHSTTVCWMQSALPGSFEGAAYEDSGWCFVEAAISAAVKAGSNRLNLGKIPELAKSRDWRDLRQEGVRSLSAWADTHREYEPFLRRDCASARMPPLCPADVKRLLETEKTFTNNSDVEVVADLYRRFFEAVSAGASELNFSQLAWDDKEIQMLVLALPHFVRLESLNLSRNCSAWGGGLHVAGAKVLAEYLAVSATLTSLDLSSDTLQVDIKCIISTIFDALRSNTSVLKKLFLDFNSLGDSGAIAIGEGLKGNTHLEELVLQRCKIGPTGAVGLAEGLVSSVLTTLNLADNVISGIDWRSFRGTTTDVGLKAIVVALRSDTSVLTRIDLRNNALKSFDGAEEQLRSAAGTKPWAVEVLFGEGNFSGCDFEPRRAYKDAAY